MLKLKKIFWIALPLSFGICFLLLIVFSLKLWLFPILLSPLVLLALSWETFLAYKDNDWEKFPIWYTKLVRDSKVGVLILLISTSIVVLSLIFLGGPFR